MADIIILVLPTVISICYLSNIGKKLERIKGAIEKIKSEMIYNMILMVLQIITIIFEPIIISAWGDTTFEYGAIISTIIWIISIPLALQHEKVHKKLQKFKTDAYDKLVVYCTNCGCAMSYEIQYCTHCGKKLEEKKG